MREFPPYCEKKMKPRKTINSARCYVVQDSDGQTDPDSELWTYTAEDANGRMVTCSVWEPTPEERAAIAAGENVRLIVWGVRMVPVAMDLTDEVLDPADPG